MNNGNVNNNNKTNTNRARAVAPAQPSSATPQGVYDIPFSTIIEAWIECERNKRTSNSCTKFRWHAARDLVALWKQMCAGEYEPLSSMCFMVTYPVLREVWAGAFRDRVAHHWEHLRYQPVLESYFIEAGDRSMNCRVGYGSLRAVETFNKAIYDFTEGYTRNDCYIVGGDFANFFMSADKPLIWPLLEELIVWSYDKPDLQALLYMMHKTMFHRCQDKFFLRSPKEMWNNLPHRKSLFYQDGMAIGNLPSQNWMNFVGAIATMYAVYKMKLAGFIIFPAAFSVGIQPDAGPSLLFITLPNVFQQAFGNIPWLAIVLSIMFYVLLALAALTSTISLHEVVTAYLHEEFKFTRGKAARLVTAGCIILGVLCSLSLGVGKDYTIFGLNLFDLFDFVTAKIMLPLGGFFISLFTGWYLDKKIVWEEVSNNGTLNIYIYRLLIFILKYIAPIGIGLIFINELGFFK